MLTSGYLPVCPVTLLSLLRFCSQGHAVEKIHYVHQKRTFVPSPSSFLSDSFDLHTLFLRHNTSNFFLSFHKAPQKGLRGSLGHQLLSIHWFMLTEIHLISALQWHCYSKPRAPHSSHVATTAPICCSLRCSCWTSVSTCAIPHYFHGGPHCQAVWAMMPQAIAKFYHRAHDFFPLFMHFFLICSNTHLRSRCTITRRCLTFLHQNNWSG